MYIFVALGINSTTEAEKALIVVQDKTIGSDEAYTIDVLETS